MIKKALRSLRLHHKILFGFLFTLTITLVVSILTIAILIRGYNRELQKQFLNTSSMLSSHIEKELSQVESLSLSLIGDPTVQNYLYLNSSSDSMYEISKASNLMVKSLTGAFLNQRTVSSITVINSQDNSLTIGKHLSPELSRHLKEVKEMAYGAEGRHLWFCTDNSQGQIYSIRAIRNTTEISLDNLGILIINFNLPKMISSYSALTGEETVRFLLSSEDANIIYNTLEPTPSGDFVASFQQLDPYAVKNLDGTPYFIYTKSLDKFGWHLTTFFSLRALYQYNARVIATLSFIFFIIVLIQAYIAWKIARTITAPVDALIKNMERVDNNDLTTDYLAQSEAYYRQEEIGLLYRNFDHMMDQIRTLIRENYEKQLILKEAQYQSLQAQINPHFLYNTLDSINWMAKLNDQEEISKMVEALALIMRSTISTGSHLITLEKELEILKGYLYLQKSRYEDRLQYTLAIDPQALTCQIPSLTLQVLAENAIKHGPDNLVGACIIHVSAEVVDQDFVAFEVSDNGAGIPRTMLEAILNGTYEVAGSGIGLKNIMNRLKIDFDDNYTFEIDSRVGKGTTIRFRLPFRKGSTHV